ncbi:MAG: 30S ribosomal protein S20 [Deltaproteobacteria bacterium]|nr:30S ribosomal protein S20 [Deltaproteobacteria bacterium]
MANHKSALKRHRQSLKSRERNRMMKTRVKNAMKAVRLAIESNDTEATAKALQNATSILDTAASKKVIHWRTAARKISRLSVAANKI